MPIKVLTPEVVSKIAAGEVVERPASVVKELVENSLDAGATQVAVEARGGGVQAIIVIDNGEGIAGEDVEKAFERYATSKIGAAADLERIGSLGFRGEALPSIAAVSEVTMVTRSRGELAGTFLNLRNGAVIEKSKRGCPPGTTVTVRNLFRNVPARLKFLKSTTTENAHISHLVTQYSLAFPEVRFTLLIDGRTAFRSSGSGRLRDVLIEVYGLETAQAMLEIKTRDEQASFPKVTGFVSPPSVSRSNRTYLSFFVNRRWVQSRMLAYAVEEAYQGLLATGKHPIAVINILLSPHEIDVNVHPTKSEVRFRDERALFAAVQKAVRAALTEQAPVVVLTAEPRPVTAPTAEPRPVTAPTPQPVEGVGAAMEKLAPKPFVAPGDARLVPSPLPILRVLGQLSNTYVIAEGPDGMYLIDQHTAHERVLFEKIQAEPGRKAVEAQGLLEPLTVELTASQEELLKSQHEALAEYGFEVEWFGERTWLVRSVPALLKGENVADSLRQILDSLLEETAPTDWRERIAVSLACHGAVRSGQVLSDEEMKALVRQLEATQTPHSCPHGRPTIVHITSAQLEKGFGRR